MKHEEAIAVEHLTNLLFLIDRKADNAEEVRMLISIAKQSLQQLQDTARTAAQAERPHQRRRIFMPHAA